LPVCGVIFIRDRRLRLAVVVACVFELAIIGMVPDTVGRAYGARWFLDLVPFAAVGLAGLAGRVGRRPD